MNDPTLSLDYHAGVADGWELGRDDLAEELIDYLYWLEEYHSEVESFAKDIRYFIEQEVGRSAPENEEEEEEGGIDA